MVLCDNLLYNTPGTFTATFDGTIDTGVYSWSRNGINMAVEQSGIDMTQVIPALGYAMLYYRNEPIFQKIFDNVTATADGNDIGMDYMGLGFVMSGNSMFLATSTSTYVLTIPRIGISKSDLANFEDFASTNSVATSTSMKILYSVLLVCGYLTPQEIISSTFMLTDSES